MIRVCTGCNATKSPDAFYVRSDRAGLRMPCKACLRRTDGQRERRREIRSAAPERALLAGAIQRCHNPKNPSYRNYGARGIAVHETWRASFDAFLRDVGARPTPKHSLERVDNDRGYEPGNVRWATRAEQNANTRQNVTITIGGETLIRTEWARRSGVPPKAIRDRMEKLGWDAKAAIFTPVRTCLRRAA